MSSKERLFLIILAALNFTHILDFMIMMPLGNYLMPYFSINTQQFTFLVSAYSGSAAISGFAAAFFVDGFDRKKVLLFGYSGFLLGTIACGFAPSYPLLLVARLVAGSFGGLIGAQVLSMVSDLFAYERRARAMGAIMSAFAMASTFGVPFALYLANHISWHAPFLLVGGLGLIIIPLILFFIPSMTGHLQSGKKEDKWQVLSNVIQDPRQRNALIFSGMVILGHFMIIPFINPFMEFNNGYPKSVTPLIYLVGGVSSFVAANLLGALADKYGKLKIFTICVLLSIVPVYLITHEMVVPFYIMLSLFAFWFIMSTGRGVSSQALISNVVKPEHRGGFMSFNSSMQQLGTTVASLITGYVVVKHDDGKIYNYSWAGYLSIAVLLGCVFIANSIFKGFDTSKKATPEKPAVTPAQ